VRTAINSIHGELMVRVRQVLRLRNRSYLGDESRREYEPQGRNARPETKNESRAEGAERFFSARGEAAG
jgi:hypothetical protein